MAIISAYEEDSENVEPTAQSNNNAFFEDDEDNDEDEEDLLYTTSSERPYDEVLAFLLREHQQQPLQLLSRVIDYLYRETNIGAQDGVDAQVLEMIMLAAKRRGMDTKDVLAGHDKVTKLDEIFEENLEIGLDCGPKSMVSSKHEEAVEDKMVNITPMENPDANIRRDSKTSNVLRATEDNDDYFEAETTILSPLKDVPLTSNLAFTPESKTTDILLENEKMDGKSAKLKDLDPNSGNGADLEKYSWTQTLYDTTLLIPMPEGTNAKSIICDIQPRYLKVGLKGEVSLLEGDLNKPVKPSECFWNLEDGKLLAVHLQKHYTMDWWHIILEGEPEIDVTKVNLPQASLSDLHPDTRRHIEHVLFDEQEAAKELPNNKERHKDDALRKFMTESLEIYA